MTSRRESARPIALVAAGDCLSTRAGCKTVAGARWATAATALRRAVIASAFELESGVEKIDPLRWGKTISSFFPPRSSPHRRHPRPLKRLLALIGERGDRCNVRFTSIRDVAQTSQMRK